MVPDTNLIFVPKPVSPANTNEIYSKFVSTIDRSILDKSTDAMNGLLKKHNTLIGGDRNKEQFTMRGQLDCLESVLNDMITELKYHSQQVQIVSAEKETSGAIL